MAVMNQIPKTLTEISTAAAGVKVTTKTAQSWVHDNTKWLKAVLDKHSALLKDQEVEKYQAAYDGQIESIEIRDKARGDEVNNKLFVNLAQLVIDTAVDYMIAKQPVYTVEDKDQADKETKEAPIITEYRKEILGLLQKEEAQLELAELLRQGSIAGYSTVIAWVDEEGEITFGEFPVQESIPVFDTRGRLKLFIRKYDVDVTDDESGKVDTITKLEIYDGRYIIYAVSNDIGDAYILDEEEIDTGNPVEHKAGCIPVSIFINGTAAKHEVRARRAGTSDLGNGVFSLLEAYANGLSDKANLTDYLQDQYLLLKGVDTDEKEVLKMRKARAIALKSTDSDASFIAQDQADGAVENYLNRLRDTIHDMTFTPKINDLSGATATEIKMKYAPLDIKAGKKEVFFIVALKQLIRILTDFLNARKLGDKAYDVLSDKEALDKRADLYKAEWLTLKLNRNLPQNYKELADIVAELSGKVPDSYLLELLWFVDDPVKALEELKQQKADALKDSMATMGYTGEFASTGTSSTGDSTTGDDGTSEE